MEQRLSAPPPVYHSPQGVNQEGPALLCVAATTDLREGNLLVNLGSASRPSPRFKTKEERATYLEFSINGLKKERSFPAAMRCIRPLGIDYSPY